MSWLITETVDADCSENSDIKGHETYEKIKLISNVELDQTKRHQPYWCENIKCIEGKQKLVQKYNPLRRKLMDKRRRENGIWRQNWSDVSMYDKELYKKL